MESNHFMQIDGREVPVKMRRNAQAKRIVLRLSRDGGEVRLTLPRRCSQKKALAFANTQQEWIRRQLAKKPKRVAFVPGMRLPVLGNEWQFHHHEAHLTKQESDQVYIGGDREFFERRVTDFIKKQAREHFSAIAQEMAQMLGVTLAGLRLRDTSSRWGSCSKDRRINLSWRLALAPSEVAHYVIAHEVAHLKHFDHSPAFWAVVEQLHPHWQKERQWLHEHGATLHAYGR